MKNKISMLLKSLIVKLSMSLKRFPEALVFATGTVITLIALNHTNYSNHESFRRIAMIFALGIPSSLSTKVYIERVNGSLNKRMIFLAGIVGLLWLYYKFLLSEFNLVTGTRYIGTTLALYLLFTVIPYYNRKNHYELYLVNLLTRLFITYLYGVILFLGLAFTLFTINTLFNLNLSYELYFDIWLVVVGIFAPAYFLADIPNYEEEEIYDDYSKILRALLLYIVMPIIVIYTSILYVYFLKILVQRQWPEGLVSHLVLWYSIVSAAVIILVYPLRNSNRWVNTFVSYFPKTIIPILLMMFISISIRINAYGITENRYYVFVAGIWIAGTMIYFAFRNKTRNVYIVMALIVVSIISVYGPISSYSISKISQNNRFEKLLSKYDMISQGQITQGSSEISQEDKQQISSIVIYFNSMHRLKAMRVIPDNYEIKDIEDALGFQITYHWGGPYDQREYFRYHMKEEGRIINVSDYNYFIEIPSYRVVNMELLEENMFVAYNNEDRIFKLRKGNTDVYTKALDDIVKNFAITAGDKYELDSNEMIFEDKVNNITVKYLINNVSGYRDKSSNSIMIDYIDFKVLIKLDNN